MTKESKELTYICLTAFNHEGKFYKLGDSFGSKSQDTIKRFLAAGRIEAVKG